MTDLPHQLANRLSGLALRGKNWRRRRDFNANQSGAYKCFSEGNSTETRSYRASPFPELLKQLAAFFVHRRLNSRHFGQ
jgi:hypothetical protein